MICECGASLLAAVGEETITTVEGMQMVFRRRTDYVLCPRCLRLYSVSQLRGEESGEMDRLHIVEPDVEDRIPLEDQFG